MASDRSLIDRLVGLRTARTPVFAKDGKRLFHLADDSGLMQVWALDLEGGARRQLTFHDEPVAFLARSPADDTLVYGTDLGGDERQQLHLLPAGGGDARPLTRQPQAIHDWGCFAPAGDRIAYTANTRDGVDFDLYVRDLEGGTERRLAELSGQHTAAGWSRDGRVIAVVEERSHFDHALRLVDVATGAARRVETPGASRLAGLRWRKEGGGFYCLTELGGEHLGIAAYDAAADTFGAVFMLPDADIDAFSPSPDGTRLAATINRRGWSELVLVDAASGAAQPVAGMPPAVAGDLAWSPDGTILALCLTAPAMPAGIWAVDLAKGGPPRLLVGETRSGAAAGFQEWRLTEFPTFDGRPIPTFIAAPGADAPARAGKAAVWIHGGPEAQTRPVFRPDIQALLASGFTVMLPNIRGSTGYGRSYAALDDGTRRLDAVEDVRQARLWLGAQPGIDGTAVAAMGQSYGGFMVLATLTRHPELWKAGVEHYGFADFLTELRDTGAWRRRHRAAEYGDPERDRDFLRDASPLTHAQRIRAPLLVSHGLRDPRVPPSETHALVAAMRAHGQAVETVLVEHAGHGYHRPEHRRQVWSAVLDFLDRNL
jgi:dipeptidyl aminopeptidase/acylaminoacyl peptidase